MRIALIASLMLASSMGWAAGPAEADGRFHEAPELAALVAAGKLPPVEQRLPAEPFVVEPCDGIGVYGGNWRRAHLGPQDAFGATYIVGETLLVYSPDYKRILPCIARAYELSEDYRSIVFHLRPGMRWSDGAPLTADDYLFWYEAVALNKELTPATDRWLARDGEFMKMEKIDTYTFRISFKAPYAALPDYIAGLYGPTMVLPKHYAKQFHPDYVPAEEMKRLVTEGGFAHWTNMFGRKTYYISNHECPTLNAWNAIEDYSGAVQRWKRNPYYWKVDPAGNQLPYIDTQSYAQVSDPEALLLKARAGEIDMQSRRIGGINESGIDNYPFLAEGAEKGGYRLVVQNTFRQIKYGIILNYSIGAKKKNGEAANGEPPRILQEKHRLFHDLRFRRALSHALNRDELNHFCQQGLGIPAQFAASPESRWFEKEALEAHTAYDPTLANRLLDETGLDKWDKAHRFRLLLTGDPLVIFMRVQVPNVEAMELVREMWAEVGVNMAVSPVQTGYWYQMNANGNFDMTCAAPTAGWDGCYRHSITAPPYGWQYGSPTWFQWYTTRGRAGDEPPQWAKDMHDLAEQAISLPRGAEQDDLIRRMTRMWADNLLTIGTVMSPPEATFAVVNKRMRNVPDPLPTIQCAHPSVFYYEGGSNGAKE